jgi:hypothetical protein
MISRPKVTQPEGLQIKLFPHQLALIYQMELLENQQIVESSNIKKETRLGINADQTASGKTYSMIGLIIRDKMQWNMNIPHVIENITYEAGGLIKNTHINLYTRLRTTLILLSSTLILQWETEFSYSNLNIKIITKRQDVENVNPENYDVILVIPTMYNILVSSYSKYIWKRFIFDEPGHTRVTGMRDIKAGFNWLISATPSAIKLYHNNCKGSMMKNIIGDCKLDFNTQFSSIIFRNDEEFIKQSFKLPMIEYHNHSCFQPISFVVNGLVNSSIQTLIESGNISGAIVSLGGTTSVNINIVEIIKLQKENRIKDIQKRIKSTKDPEQITELQDKLSHIKTQIVELKERFNKMTQDTCHICMEPLNNPVLEPKCHNLFCGKCLLHWLEKKNTCPLCRNNICLSELIHIESSNNTPRQTISTRLPTKVETIIDLLTSKTDKKFLIFSSHSGSFDPIYSILDDRDIEYVNVQGTSIMRKKSIDKYRFGSCNIIFLNSRYSAAGINLPESTDLILYHRMDTMTTNQIIGRAQRLGRTSILNIHSLT